MTHSGRESKKGGGGGGEIKRQRGRRDGKREKERSKERNSARKVFLSSRGGVEREREEGDGEMLPTPHPHPTKHNLPPPLHPPPFTSKEWP